MGPQYVLHGALTYINSPGGYYSAGELLSCMDTSVVRILKFDDPIRKISVVSETDPDPKSMLKT